MNIKLTHFKSAPAITATLDRNRSFIETLMSNLAPRFSSLFLNCLSDPRGLNFSIPYITYIIFISDEVVEQSNKHHGNTVVNQQMVVRFVDMFITSKVEELPPALYYIPKYNLFHYGNICHLNTCLQMLASLWHLLNAIASIPDDTIPYGLALLNTVLCSSYSQVDHNPCVLKYLIQLLNINISTIIPAEETMTQLIDLFEDKIPKSLILNWNYAHSNLKDKADTDLNLDAIVTKYMPKYLLVNAQDFNVEKEVTKNTEFVPVYNVNGQNYRLASVIVHVGGAHFINVFFRGNTNVVKDDMTHRYKTPDIDTAQLGRYQVTQCCYVQYN